MRYQFTRVPRDAQRSALLDIYRSKRRLVWGVPGTGKTKIGVDFIGALFNADKAKRALIICPRTALGIWEEQFSIDAPHLSPEYLIKDREVSWGDGIIITNYDFFRPRSAKRIITRGKRKGKKKRYVKKDRLLDLLAWRPDIIIIDEGHRIKKPTSRQSRAIQQLGKICTYAIDMTGTPTGNKKRLDLFGHFEFLKPGLLGDDFDEFKKHYAIFGGFGGFQFIKMNKKYEKELDKLIEPYVTVIEKKGIEQKTFLPIKVDLPPSAKKLYNEMEKEFIIQVDNNEITAQIALTKLGKLQQIAGGFVRGNDGVDHDLHAAKLDALREIADDLAESVDRFVVFARYLWEVQKCCEVLEKAGWLVHKLVGGMDAKAVENAYNREGGVVVCQVATGAEALSFHNTDYEVFYSPTQSLIQFTQAQYRIDRDETTKPCFYYLLQGRGTVDVKIYRELQEGREVSDSLKKIVKELRRERGL